MEVDMKKGFALATFLAAFLATPTLFAAPNLDAAKDALTSGEKTAQTGATAPADETSELSKPQINSDDIADKAKEKVNEQIDKAKGDLKDKAKEMVKEKTGLDKDGGALNQVPEAATPDKPGVQDLPGKLETDSKLPDGAAKALGQ